MCEMTKESYVKSQKIELWSTVSRLKFLVRLRSGKCSVCCVKTANM